MFGGVAYQVGKVRKKMGVLCHKRNVPSCPFRLGFYSSQQYHYKWCKIRDASRVV